MGYAITPIAVDLKRVEGVFGSGDERIVDAICEAFGSNFREIDKQAADYAEDTEAEVALTVRDALLQMVNGRRYDEGLGFLYGNALEYLCMHLGECLPNEGWSAMSWQWIESADEALGSVGVDEAVLRLGHLTTRGAPFPLPPIDDFPAIGYLFGAEIGVALRAFDEEQLARVQDHEMRDSLAELRGWFRRCEADRLDLICFYG